jgi:hypothetical protein
MEAGAEWGIAAGEVFGLAGRGPAPGFGADDSASALAQGQSFCCYDSNNSLKSAIESRTKSGCIFEACA